MRLKVSTIKVISRKASPIVTCNDSIRIREGHNFEDNTLSKLDCDRVRACYKFEKALHHEGGVAFARVHSTSKYDDFLFDEWHYSRVVLFCHTVEAIF